VNPGVAIADSTIYENSTSEILLKLGRVINAPYEVVRQQNLDIFSVQLRIIGRKLGNALYNRILNTISDNATTVDASSHDITYNDLITLYSTFTNYDMNVLIASPAICSKILSISEINDCCHPQTVDNAIILPFGAKLIKCSSMSDDYIYALDKNFAIEYVTATDIFMETDNVINRQLDRLAVSTQFLFRCLESNAMKALVIPEAE
jgi:hypothetical protein